MTWFTTISIPILSLQQCFMKYCVLKYFTLFSLMLQRLLFNVEDLSNKEPFYLSSKYYQSRPSPATVELMYSF